MILFSLVSAAAAAGRVLMPPRAENYHGSNTVFLVGMLMSVVGGVFITFALMALCYRSVVVHKNFSLCLRLVSRKQTEGSFHTIFLLLSLVFFSHSYPSSSFFFFHSVSILAHCLDAVHLVVLVQSLPIGSDKARSIHVNFFPLSIAHCPLPDAQTPPGHVV